MSCCKSPALCVGISQKKKKKSNQIKEPHLSARSVRDPTYSHDVRSLREWRAFWDKLSKHWQQWWWGRILCIASLIHVVQLKGRIFFLHSYYLWPLAFSVFYCQLLSAQNKPLQVFAKARPAFSYSLTFRRNTTQFCRISALSSCFKVTNDLALHSIAPSWIWLEKSPCVDAVEGDFLGRERSRVSWVNCCFKLRRPEAEITVLSFRASGIQATGSICYQQIGL